MTARVIHLHIPRTAGSSLDAHLKSALNAADVEYESGHSYFDEMMGRHNDKLKTIMFVALRDPVARVASYYNYVRNIEGHPKAENFLNYPLQELLDWPNAAHSQLCNGQARQIVGRRGKEGAISVSDLGEAMSRLGRKDVIVTTTEDIDAGLATLSARVGVPIPPLTSRKNQSSGAAPDQITELKILVRNFVDWRLYKMARGGVFD